MSRSRAATIAVVAAAAAAVIGVVVLALTGNAPTPIQRAADAIAGREPTCPLTGAPTPGGDEAPTRPLLAVKVENTDDAYPLAGLDRADMVYEEVVEGGITRFVVLFHCRGADRVGPVRSARTTDPKILSQFQEAAVLGFAGGAPRVVRELVDAGIVQLTEVTAPSAFARDGARSVPHNLFTSTAALWEAADAEGAEGVPQPVFTFDDDRPGGARTARVDLVFSGLSATAWVWENGRWVRQLDGGPMVLERESLVTADNVVIQLVKVTDDTIVDASGAASPLVQMTGTGKAWVLRDGRAVVGTWERRDESDVTVFRDRNGEQIQLRPGVTWVELVPLEGSVSLTAPVPQT
jgi:hypothetical protein